jgi:hypothetical protein
MAVPIRLCIASLLIFSIVAFRYRFVDITPLAYKKALLHCPDGILLVDKTGAVLEHNFAFDRYFDLSFENRPLENQRVAKACHFFTFTGVSCRWFDC